MDKKQINESLNMIMDGKVWDDVKKVWYDKKDKAKKIWRDHKGKIIKAGKITGVVAATIAGGAGAGMLVGKLGKSSIEKKQEKYKITDK